MERTERFYKIQNLLRSRRFVSTQDFLAELGVSRATFKRDLEYLRDRMHAPIVFDREQEAYGFDPKVADSQLWQLPGLWFSADELQALLTMDRLLGDLQPGVLSELIAPLRKRLKSLLESGEHSAEDIARRIRILTMGSRRVVPAHFRTLATAVLTRRRLHLRTSGGRTARCSNAKFRRSAWCTTATTGTSTRSATSGRRCARSGSTRSKRRPSSDKEAKEVAEDALERHLRQRLRHFRGRDDAGGRAAVRRRAARAGCRARPGIRTRSARRSSTARTCSGSPTRRNPSSSWTS